MTAECMPGGEAARVMVYSPGTGGCYLFLYRTVQDGPAFADIWFEDTSKAVACAEDEFGAIPAAWQEVPDPEPGYRHDILRPVNISSEGGQE